MGEAQEGLTAHLGPPAALLFAFLSIHLPVTAAVIVPMRVPHWRDPYRAFFFAYNWGAIDKTSVKVTIRVALA
jgi:hypothetical protein